MAQAFHTDLAEGKVLSVILTLEKKVQTVHPSCTTDKVKSLDMTALREYHLMFLKSEGSHSSHIRLFLLSL